MVTKGTCWHHVQTFIACTSVKCMMNNGPGLELNANHYWILNGHRFAFACHFLSLKSFSLVEKNIVQCHLLVMNLTEASPRFKCESISQLFFGVILDKILETCFFYEKKKTHIQLLIFYFILFLSCLGVCNTWNYRCLCIWQLERGNIEFKYIYNYLR